MSNIVEAVLVQKRAGECPNCHRSLMQFHDRVELGKVYRVDLDTRATETLVNTEHGVEWKCEMVEDADHPGELIPTEALRRNGQPI